VTAGEKAAVRVRCDACGPRVVALSSVRLLGREDRWEYAFTCSGCGARVRRLADEALRTALRDAGAAELRVQR
jgi:DNA-directed RNA polymerase subunit RPC12/RpoP